MRNFLTLEKEKPDLDFPLAATVALGLAARRLDSPGAPSAGMLSISANSYRRSSRLASLLP
jgi:hypothetical protein